MEIIKADKKNIDKIITALGNGAVLVCPTDTVYGFLADATNKKSVDKIYNIKERPMSKPLPIFIKDLKMAKELAHISPSKEKILDKKWPGGFTFVFKRKKGIKLYGVDKDTIALRIPNYKFLNDLIEKIDKPLVQTSVNISGEPSLTDIKEIIKQFIIQKNQPDLIIDAGDLSRRQRRRGSSKKSEQKNKPSKIIDLSSGGERVLRY